MISTSIQAAWQANLKVNLILLDHLTTDMLESQGSTGGYTVAQHLAHIVGTTKYWGSLFDDGFKALPDLYFDFDPETLGFKAETNLETIKSVMLETLDKAMSAASEDSDMSKSPHANSEAFLMHMMIHDAHHRAQMLLCLKNEGHTLPAEEEFWLPWRDS